MMGYPSPRTPWGLSKGSLRASGSRRVPCTGWKTVSARIFSTRTPRREPSGAPLECCPEVSTRSASACRLPTSSGLWDRKHPTGRYRSARTPAAVRSPLNSSVPSGKTPRGRQPEPTPRSLPRSHRERSPVLTAPRSTPSSSATRRRTRQSMRTMQARRWTKGSRRGK